MTAYNSSQIEHYTYSQKFLIITNIPVYTGFHIYQYHYYCKLNQITTAFKKDSCENFKMTRTKTMNII